MHNTWSNKQALSTEQHKYRQESQSDEMLVQILFIIAVTFRVTNLHCTDTTTFIQCFSFLHTASAQIMKQTVQPDEKNKNCKTSKNYAQIKNNCDKKSELHHLLRLGAVFSQYNV